MDLFIRNLPTLDIHGFTSDIVYYAVSDFINDNIKMGNKKIVIVHGIGQGILKKEVRRLFSFDYRVKRLYGDSFNLGITIIELNDKI